MSNITKIFETIVGRFDADKMAGFNATVQFDLVGDDTKDYYVVIADGNAAYEQGMATDPAATVTMEAEDFVAMTSGELNPMMAFMQGKIKVQGDMSTVMKMQGLLTG